MKQGLLLFILWCFGSVATAQYTDGQDAGIEHIYEPKIKRKCLRTKKSIQIDGRVNEGSGLAAWNGKLWTHNDSGEASLFALDTLDGAVTEYRLPNVRNNDWEELSQDQEDFYLGDFGNNLGERDNLEILRINKAALLDGKPIVGHIHFSWPETITNGRRQKVNFDCEAMAVIGDSVFLFTKEWKKGRRTRVFSLPAQPGHYIAKYRFTLNTRLLVTGASFNAKYNELVLCGYNLLLRPFLLVFNDIDRGSFFIGNGTRYKIRKCFRQVEGVSSFDGENYFLVNEDFRMWFLHTSPQLHEVNWKVN